MAGTAADFLCARLIDWGVRRVYGYPGDGINGILGALRRHQDRLEFIQVRHEEMAAFMACGHAKWTGEVGVCMATSGPGAIHLLNGLYDAKLDHQPVVAVVGQAPVSSLGGDTQQEVDLLSLYGDVAAAFVQQVNDPSALRHCLDRAFRIADAERTVTSVIVPADVQEMDAIAEQPPGLKAIHTGIGYARPRLVPEPRELERAAEVLNAGRRVAILVGAGALDATDEVLAVAERLAAGVAKALLGKAAVPDDVPFCTGSIGLLGTRPSWELMQRADTLLMVGSSFPYSNFLPPIGQVRGVQIDRAPRRLSLRYPMEVNLVGDSKATLIELLPLLHRRQERSFQDELIRETEAWWRLMDERGQPTEHENRLRPQGLFAAISRHLPEAAILSSDSGSAANWFARHVRIRRGMKASLSGNLATMGPGVPYAIAAKFAYPERVAVAMVGDGAMQMGSMTELITAAKYYRTWQDPRLVVLVLNNQDLNQVTWEQRVMAGDPKFEASQEIPYIDYAQYARLIGLEGIKVTRASEIEPAVKAAFAADRPAVIDAATDPEEPPLPPHITFQEAIRYGRAILGAPREGIPGALEAVREKVEELRPGR
jgi:pyruvate dehydrogenase (quinone)